MTSKKIDDRIIVVTELLLNYEQNSEEQKSLMDELRLFQTISKSWQIVENTYISDNNLLTHLNNLTQNILQEREEGFWANPYLDEAKAILEICKTWVEAGTINSNANYVIDDGTEDIKQRALAENLKRNYYQFVQYFWDVIVMNQPVWNWHMRVICDELQELGEAIVNDNPAWNLVINVPPATSKSLLVSNFWNAWLWANAPSKRIISSSHTAELSTRDAVLTRDIVTSAKYKLLFPNVQIRQDSGAKGFYKNTEGGFRYVTSTSSTPTGQHGDVKIVDDPLGAFQARSEADRNAAIEHVKALFTRNVSPEKFTPMVLVMQRLHPQDVTAYFLGLGLNTRHLCLPAEDSELVRPIELRSNYTNGLLDEVRLNRDVLETRKRELGSDRYAGEFLQNPLLAAGLLYEEFRTYQVVPREEYMCRYCTIDVAEGGKDDLCAIIADDRISGIYVIDVYVSDKNTDVTIPTLADMLTKYRVEEVKVERNAAGRLFSVELERQLRLRKNFTTKVKTFWSKENKESRIYLNAVEVQNNTWMPIGWKSMWSEFANQITNRQKLGIHLKDDCVDNLSNLHIYRPYKRQNQINVNNFKEQFGLL